MKIKRNQQADFRTEKYTRFGIRKYSFGAASVAIATGLMFLGSGTVSANELTSQATGDQTITEKNKSDLLKDNQKSESTYEAPAVIPGIDSKEYQGSENNKEPNNDEKKQTPKKPEDNFNKKTNPNASTNKTQSGKATLNEGKQGKHVVGHNNFQQGKGEVDMQTASNILNDFQGTGQKN